jgi:hypothetical protein
MDAIGKITVKDVEVRGREMQVIVHTAPMNFTLGKVGDQEKLTLLSPCCGAMWRLVHFNSTDQSWQVNFQLEADMKSAHFCGKCQKKFSFDMGQDDLFFTDRSRENDFFTTWNNGDYGDFIEQAMADGVLLQFVDEAFTWIDMMGLALAGRNRDPKDNAMVDLLRALRTVAEKYELPLKANTEESA